MSFLTQSNMCDRKTVQDLCDETWSEVDFVSNLEAEVEVESVHDAIDEDDLFGLEYGIGDGENTNGELADIVGENIVGCKIQNAKHTKKAIDRLEKEIQAEKQKEKAERELKEKNKVDVSKLMSVAKWVGSKVAKVNAIKIKVPSVRKNKRHTQKPQTQPQIEKKVIEKFVLFNEPYIKAPVQGPQSFEKTSMCRSVILGIPCPHRVCKFAHSKDELVIRMCLNGQCCKMVVYEDKVENRIGSTKICMFMHPQETRQDYEVRITGKRVSPKLEKSEKPKAKIQKVKPQNKRELKFEKVELGNGRKKIAPKKVEVKVDVKKEEKTKEDYERIKKEKEERIIKKLEEEKLAAENKRKKQEEDFMKYVLNSKSGETYYKDEDNEDCVCENWEDSCSDVKISPLTMSIATPIPTSMNISTPVASPIKVVPTHHTHSTPVASPIKVIPTHHTHSTPVASPIKVIPTHSTPVAIKVIPTFPAPAGLVSTPIVSAQVKPIVIKFDQPIAHKPITIVKSSEVSESRIGTALCRTVERGDVCPYGVKCKFAHYLDDFEPKKCNFGRMCRFIIYDLKNCVFINKSEEHACMFRHEGETRENFFDRVKVYSSIPKNKNSKPEPKISKPRIIEHLPISSSPNTSMAWSAVVSQETIKPIVKEIVIEKKEALPSVSQTSSEKIAKVERVVLIPENAKIMRKKQQTDKPKKYVPEKVLKSQVQVEVSPALAQVEVSPALAQVEVSPALAQVTTIPKRIRRTLTEKTTPNLEIKNLDTAECTRNTEIVMRQEITQNDRIVLAEPKVCRRTLRDKLHSELNLLTSETPKCVEINSIEADKLVCHRQIPLPRHHKAKSCPVFAQFPIFTHLSFSKFDR